MAASATGPGGTGVGAVPATGPGGFGVGAVASSGLSAPATTSDVAARAPDFALGLDALATGNTVPLVDQLHQMYSNDPRGFFGAVSSLTDALKVQGFELGVGPGGQVGLINFQSGIGESQASPVPTVPPNTAPSGMLDPEPVSMIQGSTGPDASMATTQATAANQTSPAPTPGAVPGAHHEPQPHAAQAPIDPAALVHAVAAQPPQTSGSAPFAHVMTDMNLTAEQQDFLHRNLVDRQPLKAGEKGQNSAFESRFEGGKVGIEKPQSGEDPDLRSESSYGPMWRNELGAYAVDRAANLGVVPMTAPITGIDGPGSIQQYVGSPMDSRGVDAYSQIDQQKMAILDYIQGNGDRHGANWKSQDLLPGQAAGDGNVAAIDNGMSFPNDSAEAMLRSDFVTNMLDKAIDPALLDSVRTIDEGALVQQLQHLELSPESIQGTMDRLHEIQTNGMITGESWKGFVLSSSAASFAGKLADVKTWKGGWK